MMAIIGQRRSMFLPFCPDHWATAFLKELVPGADAASAGELQLADGAVELVARLADLNRTRGDHGKRLYIAV